jgi:hypothetical protein
MLSNNPEYLIIYHLSGPVGAGLKEFYCIKHSHIHVQVAYSNKSVLIRKTHFFENRPFFQYKICQHFLLFRGILTASCFTIIHFMVCFTTHPQPLPKRVFHRVQSSASSLNFQYPVVSVRSSISCVCVHPLLPVTSIMFPPVTCFRR